MIDETELRPTLTVCCPATGEVVGHGTTERPSDIEIAVKPSRQILEIRLAKPASERYAVAEILAELVMQRHRELVSGINAEAGKTKWKSIAETKLILSKHGLAVTAYRLRWSSPHWFCGG